MAPSPKAVAPVLCSTTYVSAAAAWSMSSPSGAKSVSWSPTVTLKLRATAMDMATAFSAST
eukprot:5817264-Alexandrium_andersonii.AAC.1